MKRLLIVYNPNSSRFIDVEKEVLAPAKKLQGYLIGKYEVEKTNLETNVTKLSRPAVMLLALSHLMALLNLVKMLL